MFAAGAILMLTVLPDGPLRDEPSLPWWTFALGFYAAELLVVHLSFGRDAHTFSMSEVPLVVGLALASPTTLIFAQVLGNLGVLAGHRRQVPHKLVFNLAEFALQSTIAIAVYRAIVAAGQVVAPAGWAGAVVATTAALAAAHLMVYTAIRVTGGSVGLRQLLEAAAFSAGASLMNTIVGLLVLAAVLSAAPFVAFALLPLVVVYAAYRWFASSRQERTRLKALYEATRDLHQSPQLETALIAAARHARAIFDAEVCEIRLSPIGPDDVYRTMVGPGDHLATMQRVDHELGRSAWDLISEQPEAAIVDVEAGLTIDDVDGAPEPVVAAMVAPVTIDGGLVGSVMVANHIGEVGVFQAHDLELLQTLAAQVAVSVENGRLEDSLAALTELKEELKHQALHDALTGLGNRTLFAERVEHALDRAIRSGAELAVLFLDLDDFKTVNDSLGHTAGDELLVGIGNRLRSHCRPGDTIARLGGDEFAVLLEEIGSIRDATVVAERILEGLAAPLWIENREVTIGASIGIAIGGSEDSVGQVLRDADAAMYVAKRSGKGTFRLFEAAMHAEVVEQLQLRTELDAASARDELHLVYQPVVDLRSGRIRGFEALIRWDHHRRGLLTPDQFLDFAEESGQIHQIGDWVLETALRRHRDVLDLTPAGGELEIAVNVSARQLENESFADDVIRAISHSGVPPNRLVLEITETAVMNAPLQSIEPLRELGIRIAVDDFGTGYSSLASLDRLPVDVLKVDKVFVDGMSRTQDTSPLISTIVGLSQWLGLYTVVEGIETQWQLDRLRALGCNIGQGFLFSPPVEPATMMTLARRQGAGEILFDTGSSGRQLRSVQSPDDPAASA
ncbi:MAG: EAL domain-containing protein [Acidimicrobiia bacterium]|nr:EAL domain-containing protein [Acidimicrobiia bacterium]